MFGWRLLHAGVKVGVRRMQTASRQMPTRICCPAQQYQQQLQLETFSHLFVECPVAAAAWQWFVSQVWQRVQPEAAVPLGSSRVLLLDAAGTSGSTGYTAKAVACRFYKELQQLVQRQHIRVGSDIRLASGIPATWLRGRSPIIEDDDFWQTWGALYRMGHDGRVRARFSTAL